MAALDDADRGLFLHPGGGDQQRLHGPIEKVLQKGSLDHEQLLAEVSALMAGYNRHK